eukprot:scaffold7734_cov592-Prasinococcus_capsulatus_cf.AAC.2
MRGPSGTRRGRTDPRAEKHEEDQEQDYLQEVGHHEQNNSQIGTDVARIEADKAEPKVASQADVEHVRVALGAHDDEHEPLNDAARDGEPLEERKSGVVASLGGTEVRCAQLRHAHATAPPDVYHEVYRHQGQPDGFEHEPHLDR